MDMHKFALLLQYMGFALVPIDPLEEASEDDEDVIIDITWNRTHVKGILRKTQAPCGCSSQEEIINNLLRKFKGSEPSTTNAVDVSTTSMMPPISSRNETNLNSHNVIDDPHVNTNLNANEVVASPPKLTSSPLSSPKSTSPGKLPELLKSIMELSKEAYERVTSEDVKPFKLKKRISEITISPLIDRDMPLMGGTVNMNVTHSKEFLLRPRTPTNQMDNPRPSSQKKSKLQPPTRLSFFKKKLAVTPKGESTAMKRCDTPKPLVTKKINGRDVFTAAGPSMDRVKSSTRVPYSGASIPKWK